MQAMGIFWDWNPGADYPFRCAACEAYKRSGLVAKRMSEWSWVDHVNGGEHQKAWQWWSSVHSPHPHVPTSGDYLAITGERRDFWYWSRQPHPNLMRRFEGPPPPPPPPSGPSLSPGPGAAPRYKVPPMQPRGPSLSPNLSAGMPGSSGQSPGQASSSWQTPGPAATSAAPAAMLACQAPNPSLSPDPPPPPLAPRVFAWAWEHPRLHAWWTTEGHLDPASSRSTVSRCLTLAHPDHHQGTPTLWSDEMAALTRAFIDIRDECARLLQQPPEPLELEL